LVWTGALVFCGVGVEVKDGRGLLVALGVVRAPESCARGLPAEAGASAGGSSSWSLALTEFAESSADPTAAPARTT
jgi:hypothetical protein